MIRLGYVSDCGVDGGWVDTMDWLTRTAFWTAGLALPVITAFFLKDKMKHM